VRCQREKKLAHSVASIGKKANSVSRISAGDSKPQPNRLCRRRSAVLTCSGAAELVDSSGSYPVVELERDAGMTVTGIAMLITSASGSAGAD